LKKRTLGKTGIDISPLVLGGNVFGWTIDEKTSMDVLDAYVDHGFNAIDTADVYSAWVPGNRGGESETIIGRWLKERPAIRNQIVIFTKVGSDLGESGKKGLSARWIRQAVDESLARLGVERIDVYFSHWPDKDIPYEETLAGFEELKGAGKIRAAGASNLNSIQLSDALAVSRKRELPRYEVLQPEYNLYDRASYDGDLRDLCIKENIGVVTYYSLASGFLAGKYRSKSDLGKSARGAGIAKYLDQRGTRILDALDEIANRQNVRPSEVALAWLMARKGVTAPITSATKREHVESFARAASLTLPAEELAFLNEAST
jgi:aryl-alcohol dehydrogenase-like predicted oxidoreductase